MGMTSQSPCAHTNITHPAMTMRMRNIICIVTQVLLPVNVMIGNKIGNPHVIASVRPLALSHVVMASTRGHGSQVVMAHSQVVMASDAQLLDIINTAGRRVAVIVYVVGTSSCQSSCIRFQTFAREQ